MLLDIIDNLPRLRLSSSQLQIIMWLLQQCRVQDVPSFKAFRKMQEGFRDTVGSKPTPHTSSLENLFYVNDVRDAVARVSYCLRYCFRS